MRLYVQSICLCVVCAYVYLYHVLIIVNSLLYIFNNNEQNVNRGMDAL